MSGVESKVLTPKVNAAQEFIEIAFDFSNPLDLVREAISNAFDAHATELRLDFSVVPREGENILRIRIEDNGDGMDFDGLQSFFDLGNSLHKDDENSIGEKGHGTKVYFNSKGIEVDTVKAGKNYHAVMESPKKSLYNQQIPEVSVEASDAGGKASGTCITIWEYNNNRRDRFTFEQLKDYILWFTKFGSVEKEFGILDHSGFQLFLKAVDSDREERIPFGHVFPKENCSTDRLLREHSMDAPKYYCKKFVKKGHLKNHPEISYHSVIYLEGTKAKYAYNPMIRHKGYTAPEGAYTVQERYGIWLCKDYIPVQRKNEWISTKGAEHTKLHGFVNCQGLKLTANRGSIENTPSEIIQDLSDAIRDFYEEIIQDRGWNDLSWLESEVEASTTVQRERKDFENRINKVNRGRTASYKGQVLVEPQRESGVLALFMQMCMLEPGCFPFTIVDYDTHSGIDVIAKAEKDIPIKTSALYYVEFKNHLDKNFNHSFENLHSIVCWDINLSEVKHGEEVSDIGDQPRTFQIIAPASPGDCTKYYLDSRRESRKIEVFVLKQYLKEKYHIEFTPRTDQSAL